MTMDSAIVVGVVHINALCSNFAWEEENRRETIAFADATTFATALHVLGTAGQWRRCLEILQQMQGPDLMASMAVFHAAHVASASLLCWALRSAMVQAFKHPLADVAGSRVRRRLRVEATMQLGKLESCVCAWQGGRMTHRRREASAPGCCIGAAGRRIPITG